jgi:RimJ/RimL family protein N-acetyltransferase
MKKHYRMTMPNIDTQRLFLSGLTLKDIAIARYQSWYPVTYASVEQLIKQQNQAAFGKGTQWFQFGIHLLSEPTMIGDIGVHFLEGQPAKAEIGYSIARNYQRQGYASESVCAILDTCFIICCLNKSQLPVIHATTPRYAC